MPPQSLVSRMQQTSDDLLGWARTVTDAGSNPEVCVHWSIKQNYQRGAGKAHAKLQAFCDSLPVRSTQNKWPILLVSGGGAKRQYNTVSALEQIAEEHDTAATRRKVEWHVAYNPYIPQVLCCFTGTDLAASHSIDPRVATSWDESHVLPHCRTRSRK